MKFFHEHPNFPHLDIRFYNSRFNYKKYNKKILRGLLSVLTDLCEKNNVKCIIGHGTLIGHYFNQKMLPWDDDIDVVLLEDCVPNFLKIRHNSTFHKLEINPNWKNRSPLDRQNVIDARLICKKTGIFIDITFLTYNRLRKGIINCKSPHYYPIKDFLPLSETVFEDCKVCVPNKIENVLVREYGINVLKPIYKKWRFINGKWSIS